MNDDLWDRVRGVGTEFLKECDIRYKTQEFFISTNKELQVIVISDKV